MTGKSDTSEESHYSVLGLNRDCTPTQIRDAYRLLVKLHHPDLNQNSAEAPARSQALNAAYEVLSDSARRLVYDRELDRASQAAAAPHSSIRIEKNIAQEVRLRIEDFLHGTTLEVRVKDPANPSGLETYKVTIPAMSAPGASLRVPRQEPFATGYVRLRLRVLPGFRFKVRGSDLRMDLRISAQRAEQGGTEMIERPTGGMLRVTIPRRVKRGEVVRIGGEGMPRPRGGRGDLLVRITYRPEVRILRTR